MRNKHIVFLFALVYPFNFSCIRSPMKQKRHMLDNHIARIQSERLRNFTFYRLDYRTEV